MEIWRPVKGLDGYFISNNGKIRSDKGKNPRILKTKHLPNGYEQISLNDHGTKVYRYVHRLVAEAFIDNPNNFPQVNHIDGCKVHNYVSNLEWVTISENISHAFRTGLNEIPQKERTRFALCARATFSKKVEQLTVDGKHVRYWDNACDAKRELGFDRSNIAEACRKGTVSYGYKWKYIS